MKLKNILLVGGCGFIGHNLAIKLKNDGHKVTIVDSLSVNNLLSFTDKDIKNKKLYISILNNRIELLKENGIELLVFDSKENSQMKKIFKKIKPNIVIHLAAVSHAAKSNKDPHHTFDNSLRTLESTLDNVKDGNIHVIYLSSSMVYGNFKEDQVDENSICEPIGIYGNLKLAGELMIKSFNQVFGMPYTIIRPSALYGERCVSRRVGQIFIENAIQNFDINISGDGEEKLDFTYIEDLVQGISLCCTNKNSINQIFNITYGRGRKINELADILIKNFPSTKIIYTDRDKLMPKRGTLLNEKSKDLLKFKPSFQIEQGYNKYIEWYKNFWSQQNFYEN
tara:strand:+ start:1699 stop:2712 length:1014 start_codon:yes stop_codon:yes gene_type:complete